MTEVNRRFFDDLLADRKLSLRGLAKRMSMSHSQLSLTFSGTRRLQIEEAVQLSDILAVPLADVIKASGLDLPLTNEMRVPIIGSMRADGTVESTPEGATERATVPCQMPEDTVAVQIRTAGGTMGWCDGWVLFGRQSDHVEAGCLGRLCLAKMTGGPMVVATLGRGYKEATYNLAGFHQGESVRLDWAAPIALTKN